MKYIKSIHLTGFQSHVSSSLDLHPGMNMIVGPSNSGKSAVQRGIRWATHNEPLGDGYINKTVGEADCSMLMSDGSKISRRRGKENTYQVNATIFQGFGTKVPDEVIAATGMPKAVFGEEPVWLNYASQLSPPFLLDSTSGQAARVLGKLAGTEDLDIAGKLTNSDLIKVRGQEQQYKATAVKLTADILSYSHLPEAERLLDLCEKQHVKAFETNQKLENLRKLQSALARTTASIVNIRRALEQIVIMDVAPVKEKASKYATLLRLDHDVRFVNDDIIFKEQRVQTLSAHMAAPPSLVGVQAAAAKLDKLADFRQFIVTVGARIEKGSDFLEGLKNLSTFDTTLKNTRRVSDSMHALMYGMQMLAEQRNKETEADTKLSTACAEVLRAGSEFEEMLVGLRVCPTCHGDMDPIRIHQHVVGIMQA
jgi:DNA repair protein SbcC/Rad50